MTRDPLPVVACVAHDARGLFPAMLRTSRIGAAPDCWSLPTGKCERGVTLARQAVTELQEELALDADPSTWEVLTAYDNIMGDGRHFVIVVGMIIVSDLTHMRNLEPERHSELCVLGRDAFTGLWAGFQPAMAEAMRACSARAVERMAARCKL